MQCPRCKAKMQEMINQSVKLDVCYEGCGGIWFDWLELKKVDEKHEVAPEFVEKLSKSAKKKIELADKLMCMHCENQPLLRRFSSVKRQVEVDECPKCGGFWLDAGELTHIHAEFHTEADRRKAADAVIGDMFGKDMADAKMKSEAALASAKKFAHALRFICPSYYIPGKQKGGAF